jgi:hypothetical protein
MDYNKTIVSSTTKNGRLVSQMAIYKTAGFSQTKHERIIEDDKGNIKIIPNKKTS